MNSADEPTNDIIPTNDVVKLTSKQQTKEKRTNYERSAVNGCRTVHRRKHDAVSRRLPRRNE
jgi:hypothetical protein